MDVSPFYGFLYGATPHGGGSAPDNDFTRPLYYFSLGLSILIPEEVMANAQKKQMLRHKVP